MQKAVKKSVKPEHPAKFYQIIPAEHFPERCHRQSYQQKNQSQNAGRPQKKLDWIRAEPAADCVPNQQSERHETVEENQNFVEFYIIHLGSVDVDELSYSIE
jgi:hypothetical protein